MEDSSGCRDPVTCSNRASTEIPNDIEPITEALGRLREELTVLRQLLDEILCAIQWANRNRGSDAAEPLRFLPDNQVCRRTQRLRTGPLV